MHTPTTFTPSIKTPLKSTLAPAKSPLGAGAATVPPAAAPAGKVAEPDRGAGSTPAFIEPERRRAMIAEAAYYRAERRGFEPGCELEDWCLAEVEIDGMLTRGQIELAWVGDSI